MSILKYKILHISGFGHDKTAALKKNLIAAKSSKIQKIVISSS